MQTQLTSDRWPTREAPTTAGGGGGAQDEADDEWTYPDADAEPACGTEPLSHVSHGGRARVCYPDHLASTKSVFEPTTVDALAYGEIARDEGPHGNLGTGRVAHTAEERAVRIRLKHGDVAGFRAFLTADVVAGALAPDATACEHVEFIASPPREFDQKVERRAVFEGPGLLAATGLNPLGFPHETDRLASPRDPPAATTLVLSGAAEHVATAVEAARGMEAVTLTHHDPIREQTT
jgi:hypothetical protein